MKWDNGDTEQVDPKTIIIAHKTAKIVRPMSILVEVEGVCNVGVGVGDDCENGCDGSDVCNDGENGVGGVCNIGDGDVINVIGWGLVVLRVFDLFTFVRLRLLLRILFSFNDDITQNENEKVNFYLDIKIDKIVYIM